jgi:CRISPR-associated exonuclease Cas4
MSAETETIPLSALQHFSFCPRQCALIHLERAWAENARTAEGRVLHDRAHDAGSESRRDLRIARAVPLHSTTLGVHGVSDIVEFHREPDGSWRPFPVEYKRGRPKSHSADAIQLCAQALCLEEMLGCAVPAGALFYGETHRRLDVAFDAELRAATRALAAQLHALLASRRTPPADYGPKCHACSLYSLCQPRLAPRRASAHLARLFVAHD